MKPVRCGLGILAAAIVGVAVVALGQAQPDEKPVKTLLDAVAVGDWVTEPANFEGTDSVQMTVIEKSPDTTIGDWWRQNRKARDVLNELLAKVKSLPREERTSVVEGEISAAKKAISWPSRYEVSRIGDDYIAVSDGTNERFFAKHVIRSINRKLPR